MKERRLHILFVLVLLIIQSCAKSNLVPDSSIREIGFRPIQSSQTKSETFPEDEAFGLYAFKVEAEAGTSYNSGVWTSRQEFFQNACFAKVGDTWAGCTQEGDAYVHTPYFWPAAGSLYFIGYSPYNSVSPKLRDNISGNDNLFLSIDFTQNTEISQMIDLKWFDFWVSSGLSDFSKSFTATGSALPVQFRRALSKVSFSFSDENDYYKLFSLKLTGCLNKATFYTGRIPGWGPDLTDSNADGLADNIVTYVLCDTELSSVPENDLNGFMGSALVIPQYMDGVFDNMSSSANSTGDEVELELTIADLTSDGTAVLGTQTIVLSFKDYIDKWELGKHYTYKITLNSSPIEFGPPTLEITDIIVDFL